MPNLAREAISLVSPTKYRIPRVRRTCIARDGLLRRLTAASGDSPVVSLVAPAGFGKTTLLAQFANSVQAPARVVWYAADPDDRDVSRFVAGLVDALAPLGLDWHLSTPELVANMSASPAQVRAAAGVLAAALESAPKHRIHLVVDDLQHAAGPEVAMLLEALIERLPDHVNLVLASREALSLPMSRWVLGGEAVEFGTRDLEFSAQEAEALAMATDGSPEHAQRVQEVLQQARGWPAAVALMLRPALSGDSPQSGDGTRQWLYEYLASEVLSGLPEATQQFLLDVSVLAELTPELCGAVAQCPDPRSMLRSLYRNDLFVTAIDGSLPVLRLHDLFRDFLQARLLATAPERLQLVHERAARAEPSLTRAVAHCLAAGLWHDALRLMARNADMLREHGHQQSVQRWLEQIPEAEVAATDEGLYLRALCSWLRWDWIQCRADMSRLLTRLRESGQEPPAALLLMMMGFLSAVGEREEASRIALAIDASRLTRKDKAVFALRRAWASMDAGDVGAVVRHYGEFVDAMAEDPREVAPLIVDRTSPYIGLPGMLAQYRRSLDIARTVMGADAALWHGGYWVIDGWVEFWSGRRDAAARAVSAARDIQSAFGGVTPIEDALLRLEAVLLAATGRGEEGVRLARSLVDRFALPRYASIKVVFERAYWAGLGKVAWMAGDAPIVREAARCLLAPRRPQEWRFIELVQPTLQAQVAILDRRWGEAERYLEHALALFAEVRFPQGHADPRLLAAFVQLRGGDRARAWPHLEPALDECLADDAIGPLLSEPSWLVDPLLDILPPERRRDPRHQELLRRLADWRRTSVEAPATGPLAGLSERELEVLARVAHGDGNKDIARRLGLSLHTVKRHIANILGKLDCVSRRQAAELYRQHSS